MAPHEWPSDEISPSDKGNLWHSVVERFHRQRDAATPEQDLSVFTQRWTECLLPLCADNPRYWAVQQQFTATPPHLSSGGRRANARVGKSNTANTRHKTRAQSIVDAAGHAVHELHWRGRIDQVDERMNELSEVEWSLIDYKTNNVRGYQQSIRNHEDTQLAFYINLIESAVEATGAAEPIVDASLCRCGSPCRSHFCPKRF